MTPTQLTTVSVPFNAGRGLMPCSRACKDKYMKGFSTLQCGSWIDASHSFPSLFNLSSFSTLQCGSWIDAPDCLPVSPLPRYVSVPFNAGRGLMLVRKTRESMTNSSFSTLQCGSWIDATRPREDEIDYTVFQYPSMRVVD